MNKGMSQNLKEAINGFGGQIFKNLHIDEQQLANHRDVWKFGKQWEIATIQLGCGFNLLKDQPYLVQIPISTSIFSNGWLNHNLDELQRSGFHPQNVWKSWQQGWTQGIANVKFPGLAMPQRWGEKGEGARKQLKIRSATFRCVLNLGIAT